jgi:outer membrane lipoprotein SlyB
MNRKIWSALALALAATGPLQAAHETCVDCGTVTAIEESSSKGKATGAGAVIGAVVGGVVGHQFGQGTGKDVATVGGAAAGAYAGHQAEKAHNATGDYKVTVRMDDGTTREMHVGSPAGLTVGTRVHVSGNNLEIR